MNDVEVSGDNQNGIDGAMNAIKDQCSSDGQYDNNRHNNFDNNSSTRFDNRQSSNSYEQRNNDYYRQPEPTPEPQYVQIDWDAANREADEARRIRWSKCPTMIKNFYTEHPEVTEMTDEQVEQFREANKNIKVAHDFAKDKDAANEPMPKPVTKFNHAFESYPDLMAEIQKAGFTTPSPIQSQMWPILMKGDDCIGIAQTGTGKTLGEFYFVSAT